MLAAGRFMGTSQPEVNKNGPPCRKTFNCLNIVCADPPDRPPPP